MKIRVEMDHKEIRRAIHDYIITKYGLSIKEESIEVLVKSAQNYKSEWEIAQMKIDAMVEALYK